MSYPLEGTRVKNMFWDCRAYIPKGETESVIHCDHFSKYFSEKRQLNVPRAIMIKKDKIITFGFKPELIKQFEDNYTIKLEDVGREK